MTVNSAPRSLSATAEVVSESDCPQDRATVDGPEREQVHVVVSDSYAVSPADHCKLIAVMSAHGAEVTLPPPELLRGYIDIVNVGPGGATLVGASISGHSTVELRAGSGARITSVRIGYEFAPGGLGAMLAGNPRGDPTETLVGRSTAWRQPVSLPISVPGSNIDARRYGVKCDGLSDDADAIDRALAAGSKRVQLPRGVCLVSRSVIVQSNSELAGKGIGSTILRPSSTPDYPVVRIHAGASNVVLTSFSVDGGARSHGKRTADGVLAGAQTSNVAIYQIEVYGAADNGIESNGSRQDIWNNFVHDNYSNGIYVIGVNANSRASQDIIRNNIVIDNSVDNLPPTNPSWDGIDIDPKSASCTVEANVVVGNDIILYETGKEVSDSYGHSVTDNLIIDSSENGIDVLGAVRDFTIARNRVYRPVGDGIIMNGPQSQGTVTNNLIVEPTRRGIFLGSHVPSLPGAPNGFSIENNTIEGLPLTGGKAAGIVVQKGSYNVTLRDNIASVWRAPF